MEGTISAMFDVRILTFSTGLISFILLIEMIVLSRVFPRQGYLKFLIISYGALTLAMFGWMLRDVASDLISIVAANVLIGVRYYADICAAEKLIGRNRYYFKYYGGVLILFGMVLYYFSVIEPNFGIRVIASSLLLGTLGFIFGWRMFTYGRHLYSVCKWLGVLAMFNAITIYIRVLPGVLNTGQESFMSFSISKQLLFIVGILIIVSYGYLIVALAVQIEGQQAKEDIAADN